MLSLNEIAKVLGGEVSAVQVRAPGPGHKSPADRSLSVKVNDAGDDVVVKSFADDDPIACKDYVRAKMGMPSWTPQRRRGNGRAQPSDSDIARMLAPGNGAAPTPAPPHIVATYTYTDADGQVLYEVLRLEPKSFRQRRPDGNGGYIWNAGKRRVLYRLPDLAKYPDDTIFVVEGEKDADRLASLDYCVTTISGGSKWTPEIVAPLAGRDIVILPDNDQPGRQKAHEAARALQGIAATARICQLPDLPEKGDISIGSTPAIQRNSLRGNV